MGKVAVASSVIGVGGTGAAGLYGAHEMGIFANANGPGLVKYSYRYIADT